MANTVSFVNHDEFYNSLFTCFYVYHSFSESTKLTLYLKFIDNLYLI